MCKLGPIETMGLFVVFTHSKRILAPLDREGGVMYSFSPVLIHVPHSSTCIPSDEWQYFQTDKLRDEIFCMTDHYCDDLFACSHQMVTFSVSRLVCDVERFRDDAKESMSLKGMRVVYTKGFRGDIIKEVPEEHKERILKDYYDKHHKILNQETERRVQAFGKCLIIDGHSFYESPLPYEYCQEGNRADICIGADDYHTPAILIEYMCEEFRKAGYTVSINTPFAGTLVPGNYYLRDKKVMSIMIEVNRRLYIDKNATRTKRYSVVKEDIARILEKCEIV